jgi:hypothetical protein
VVPWSVSAFLPANPSVGPRSFSEVRTTSLPTLKLPTRKPEEPKIEDHTEAQGNGPS